MAALPTPCIICYGDVQGSKRKKKTHLAVMHMFLRFCTYRTSLEAEADSTRTLPAAQMTGMAFLGLTSWDLKRVARTALQPLL